MSLFSVLLGTMKTDFLIGGPKGIMLRKVTNGFEVRSFDGSALKNLAVDSLTASTSVITDTITEKTLNAGVTVGGVVISAGLVDGKDVSTLAEDADVIKKDGSVAFTNSQSMGTHNLTSLADPRNGYPQDAATKAYVDSVATGLNIHDPVRLATTAALPAVTPAGSGVGKTLTANAHGALLVDGKAVALTDRILVKNQVNAVDDGIYTVTTLGVDDVLPGDGVAFVLTRATDYDGSPANEVTNGDYFFVTDGNTLINNSYVQLDANPIVIDTNALDFGLFSRAEQIVAGSGISRVNNTLSVNVDASSIDINGSGQVEVKDLGISTGKIAAAAVTKAKIAADVAGAGLTQNVDGSLQVNTDNSTLEVNVNTVRVKAGGITNNEVSATAAIAWSKIDKTSSSLSDLATRAYGDLTGRPADDDFITLTELTTVAADDFLPVYDASATTYKKIQRSNLISGLALDSSVVHLTGAQTVAGVKDFTSGIKTDSVVESTLNTGVTVAGVLIKAGLVDGMDVSTLAVDSTVVHNTGTEIVAGEKDFSDGIKTDTIVGSVDGTVTIGIANVTPARPAVVIGAGLVDGKDVSTLATDSDVVHLAGVETITGDKTFSGDVLVDVISERTLDAGVTIDGVLIKDGLIEGTSIDIHGITALTSVDDADELLIYDSSVAANKKITRANLLSGIAAANGIAKHIEIAVSTSTVSSTTAIPVGARVKSVVTLVNSVYSVGATLQVVVNGATPLEVQATSDNDAQTSDAYESRPFAKVLTANAGVVEVVVAGSPVIGSATVIIEYVEAPLV